MLGTKRAKQIFCAYAGCIGAAISVLAVPCNTFAQRSNNMQYVNPFIGTAKSNVLTRWGGEGGTYPGAVAPSGAIQISPETRPGGTKGYNYTDSAIYYFTCCRHLSGFPSGSAGRLQVMPVEAGSRFEAGKYHRRFNHKSETARPGYYSVLFDDGTKVEATATTRAGMLRFTFKAGKIPQLFIGDAGELVAPTKRLIHAADRNAVMMFSEDYTEKIQVQGGWLFIFAKGSNKVINVKMSTSLVGFAGAQNNLDREIGKRSFEEVVKKTEQEWARKLAVVDITDTSSNNKVIFYTALYHSLLLPWVIDDADGRYLGAGGKVQQKSGANEYGGFSPWDTFRSLNPLLTLLYPGKENDIILSMLDVYRQTGHLPTESMTGNHAIPIIVDSYLKGVDRFDKQLAYKAMKSNIMDAPFVQPDMDIYHKNDYIPFTRSESVTRTVEYAYDDWALSQFASQVVHNNDDYQLLLNRSYNYRNLLNTDALFMLPRNNNEFKLQPGMSGYKEGDKWVYTYFVPHNGKDLINLLGGNGQFSARLDSALSNNVILFDNETVFHLPYLFNQAGSPALAQKWCRQIMQDRFSNTPGGLPGNDDLGATSSWYVFSALGIYPVCSGRPLYAIGSPVFRSVTLHLANGHQLVIGSENNNAQNSYVKSFTVNDKAWEQLTLSHTTLMQGGKIKFTMDSKPGAWPADKDPVVLSETKTSPQFKLSGFSAGKTTVAPDEPFYVHFTIANTGSTGVKTIRLRVNSKEYAVKNCLVNNGETKKDSIPCRLYPVGINRLKLDDIDLIPVTVVLPSSSLHQYKITSLTARALLRLGEHQQVSYMVQNIGGTKQVFAVQVRINGSPVIKDTVSLGAGEKKAISHDLVPDSPGFQHVSIDSARVTFKVYKDNAGSVLFDLSPAKNNIGKVLKDASGFGNDGALLPAQASREYDKGGKLLFGENCFVEVPNAPSLDQMGETITMMAWVYPTGSEHGLVDIFTKGDAHVLQVTDGKTLTFFAGGWGRGDCTVNLPADWKQHWHHIAGVCSGKKLELYIDGLLKGTTLLEETADLSVNNKWTLGRNEEFPSERIYHGYISEARVFREALSAAEVWGMFDRERGGD